MKRRYKHSVIRDIMSVLKDSEVKKGGDKKRGIVRIVLKLCLFLKK